MSQNLPAVPHARHSLKQVSVPVRISAFLSRCGQSYSSSSSSCSSVVSPGSGNAFGAGATLPTGPIFFVTYTSALIPGRPTYRLPLMQRHRRRIPVHLDDLHRII